MRIARVKQGSHTVEMSMENLEPEILMEYYSSSGRLSALKGFSDHGVPYVPAWDIIIRMFTKLIQEGNNESKEEGNHGVS